MTCIPEDVLATATKLHIDSLGKSHQSLITAIASAIMAERERCAVVCDEWSDMKHVAYDLEFNGKLLPKKSPVHEALATTIRKGTKP